MAHCHYKNDNKEVSNTVVANYVQSELATLELIRQWRLNIIWLKDMVCVGRFENEARYIIPGKPNSIGNDLSDIWNLNNRVNEPEKIQGDMSIYGRAETLVEAIEIAVLELKKRA